jgi:hypothetical protein
MPPAQFRARNPDSMPRPWTSSSRVRVEGTPGEGRRRFRKVFARRRSCVGRNLELTLSPYLDTFVVT